MKTLDDIKNDGWQSAINQVVCADNLDVLPLIPGNSIDAIVTDPPYELGFMGKKWDASGIAYNVKLWQDCFRVLKPGGHLISFGGTRTYHRMAVAIEDAGFEVRDMLEWIYSSGFPKSLNVGKAVDKKNDRFYDKGFQDYCNERRNKKGYSHNKVNELMGTATTGGGFSSSIMGNKLFNELPTKEMYQKLKPILEMDNRYDELIEKTEREREVIGKDKNWGEMSESAKFTGGQEWNITKGNSVWEGFGTALKPAHEPILLARKPLSEKTIVENVLKHGTGALDIDGCRIPTREGIVRNFNDFSNVHSNQFGSGKPIKTLKSEITFEGRFPANIIVTDDALNGIRNGKNNPNYNGGYYKKCEVCDNLVWVCPYQAEKKRFCSKECRHLGHSKEMQDENNPKWRGGLSGEYKKDKTGKAWKKKRLEVYTRDNFTCQRCGNPSTKLDAHHIIPWRISLDDAISNLISLCPSCHKIVETGWINMPIPQEHSKSRYFDIDHWATKHGLLQFPKASKGERNEGCEELEDKFRAGLAGADRDTDEPLDDVSERFRTQPAKNNHPTVKPVHLMSWLVKLISKEGDVVLDMFMGSGTTGVACEKLNRKWIGIERSKEYCAIAEKRIKDVQAQTKLVNEANQ